MQFSMFLVRKGTKNWTSRLLYSGPYFPSDIFPHKVNIDFSYIFDLHNQQVLLLEFSLQKVSYGRLQYIADEHLRSSSKRKIFNVILGHVLRIFSQKHKYPHL